MESFVKDMQGILSQLNEADQQSNEMISVTYSDQFGLPPESGQTCWFIQNIVSDSCALLHLQMFGDRFERLNAKFLEAKSTPLKPIKKRPKGRNDKIDSLGKWMSSRIRGARAAVAKL